MLWFGRSAIAVTQQCLAASQLWSRINIKLPPFVWMQFWIETCGTGNVNATRFGGSNRNCESHRKKLPADWQRPGCSGSSNATTWHEIAYQVQDCMILQSVYISSFVIGTLLWIHSKIHWNNKATTQTKKSSVLSEFKSGILDQWRIAEIEGITCVHINLLQVIV